MDEPHSSKYPAGNLQKLETSLKDKPVTYIPIAVKDKIKPIRMTCAFIIWGFVSMLSTLSLTPA